MTAIENIKERYAKTYILADDNTHKLLKTMKEDILFLIGEVERNNATGVKRFDNVHDVITLA